MVYQIMQTKFKVFIESFLVTCIIFIIAFSIGMYVESYRTNRIVESYNNYEIEALDLKLQNYYYQIMDQESCEAAINQNFEFADDLYLRGLELEKFEEANQISDDLTREKKRYVLLKTELWLNTVLLKKKCNNPFDTIVYFYSADPNNTIKVAQQKIISNELKSLKKKYGNNIVLLPIAGDLAIDKDGGRLLGSIQLQKRIYNVTSLPSILVNEKIVLAGYHTQEEMREALTKTSISQRQLFSIA